MPATPEQLMAAAELLTEASFVDLLDFSDSSVVVTGGARGIGKAMASRFARQGGHVTIVDVDRDAPATARELAETTGTAVDVAHGDVRDGSALLEIARTGTRATSSRLIWANCAGIYPSHRLAELGDEEWRAVVGINLDGTFHGARAAATVASERDIRGVIVNISSVAGSRAGWPPGIAHYVASKHGVEGLTKALAVELGPRGIRVVGLAPGTVVTEGLVARFGEPGGEQDPYMQMARRMPVRRPALADDVARVAVFLASDAAAMITGCTIPVDGGHLAT